MPKTKGKKATKSTKTKPEVPKKAAGKKPDKPGMTSRGRITRGKHPRRWWTDEERLSALAALNANGGNCAITAKELGMSYHTLRAWQLGHRYPEALQLSQEKNQRLSDACEEIAWLFAAVIPEKIDKAPLNHLTTGFGIMVEKMKLLRGEPTTYGRTENTNIPINPALDWARLTDGERQQFLSLLSRLRGATRTTDGAGTPAATGDGEAGAASPVSGVSKSLPAFLK